MKMPDTVDISSCSDLVLSQSFIDSIPNGVIVSDTSLRLLLVNRWITQTLNLNLEEIIGKPLGEVFPELTRRNLMEAYQLVLQTNMPLTLSNRIHNYFIKMPPAISYANTFKEMPQSVIISPLFENDQLVGTLSTILDVTERVMTERALQIEIHKLNVLHNIFHELATLDIEQCLQVIVQNSLDVFRADAAALFLNDKDTLCIACQRPEEGLYPINEDLFRSITTSLNPGSSFTPLDPTGDGQKQENMLAEMAAPLIVEGLCIGILSVRASRQFGFTPDEQNMLDILASRAAVAIHNARLHNQEKSQRELLETLNDINVTLTSELNPDAIVDSLLESIEKVLPFDSARVIFAEKGHFRVVRHRGYESFGNADFWKNQKLSMSDFPFLSEMAVTRRPKIISDTRQDLSWHSIKALKHVQSSAGAPIFVRGVLAGFLLVEKVDPGFYTKEYVNILAAFSTQAGIALENARLYERQKKLAVVDGLTGISNRRALDETIAREIEHGLARNHNTSLIMMDIDFFKQINDTYGHLVGDSVLKNLAALLTQNIRPVDSVGRYGGEEFVVVMPETGLAGALAVAERLRKKVERMHLDWIPLTGTELPDRPVTVSMGVSCMPQCADCAKELIRSADQAMYIAKQAGRNQVVSYSEILSFSN